MPGWTLVSSHPTQGRTFRRPLDIQELAFLWDGLFNGTADILQRFELRLLDGSRDRDLFSKANILRAWVSTKRRYPLVGAIVQGAGSPNLGVAGSEAGGNRDGDNTTEPTSETCFVVRERDLAILRPHEIIFGQVTDAEDAHRQVSVILHGPRPLSQELLVQLYVFRETDSDRADVLHLMILMAHCVTDGQANRTFARCFLDR